MGRMIKLDIKLHKEVVGIRRDIPRKRWEE